VIDRGIIVVSRCMLAAISFLLCIGATPTASSGEQNNSEHSRPSNRRVVLDPKLYWYYAAMGKLEHLKTSEGQVEGSYSERGVRTEFTIKTSDLKNPVARTKGYKLAVEKIIAYMAPGAVPDNEANRKYMAELTKNLEAITGMHFTGHDDWKKWFDANHEKLQWSEAQNTLIVQE